MKIGRHVAGFPVGGMPAVEMSPFFLKKLVLVIRAHTHVDVTGEGEGEGEGEGDERFLPSAM
jgi:hypothetical protein